MNNITNFGLIHIKLWKKGGGDVGKSLQNDF